MNKNSTDFYLKADAVFYININTSPAKVPIITPAITSLTKCTPAKILVKAIISAIAKRPKPKIGFNEKPVKAITNPQAE